MGNLHNISCGIEFSVDFKEYPEYEHFNFVSVAYHVYNKSGNLPFPGSLSEQPSQMMEILDVMFELDMEREEDARAKAERERNKK